MKNQSIDLIKVDIQARDDHEVGHLEYVVGWHLLNDLFYWVGVTVPDLALSARSFQLL